jgi:hypothetical protein
LPGTFPTIAAYVFQLVISCIDVLFLTEGGGEGLSIELPTRCWTMVFMVSSWRLAVDFHKAVLAVVPLSLHPILLPTPVSLGVLDVFTRFPATVLAMALDLLYAHNAFLPGSGAHEQGKLASLERKALKSTEFLFACITTLYPIAEQAVSIVFYNAKCSQMRPFNVYMY